MKWAVKNKQNGVASCSVVGLWLLLNIDTGCYNLQSLQFINESNIPFSNDLMTFLILN